MIETDRMTFRKLTLDDLPWLIEMRSPEPVNRYLGGPMMQNAEKLAVRIRHYIDCYEKFGFGFCLTENKLTGQRMGTSGLQPLEETGEIEVGYNFSEQFWRQGYGFECAMGWLRFGFTKCGLERIVAVAHPDNTGSWRIMEKCGMKYEATEPHYGIPCVVYGISRGDFISQHGQALG
jgi:RimJ/RimL family protein N-acetyltransferase